MEIILKKNIAIIQEQRMKYVKFYLYCTFQGEHQSVHNKKSKKYEQKVTYEKV